jgi:hypothetical protein
MPDCPRSDSGTGFLARIKSEHFDESGAIHEQAQVVGRRTETAWVTVIIARTRGTRSECEKSTLEEDGFLLGRIFSPIFSQFATNLGRSRPLADIVAIHP